MPCSEWRATSGARSMPQWLKRLSIATGASVLVLIASIAFLETALRAGFAREVNEAARQHPPHPFLQVMASPWSPSTDMDSAAVPSSSTKPRERSASSRSAVSTTLGIGTASYEDTYPFKLQTMLRQRYPDVTIEVQNAGNAWYIDRTPAHRLSAVGQAVRARPHRRLRGDQRSVSELLRPLVGGRSVQARLLATIWARTFASWVPMWGCVHPRPGGPFRICSSGGDSGKTCSASPHRTVSMPPISRSCAPACARGR